jgi:hypothetical protein
MLVSGDYPTLSSTLRQAFPIITAGLQLFRALAAFGARYAEVALRHL